MESYDISTSAGFGYKRGANAAFGELESSYIAPEKQSEFTIEMANTHEEPRTHMECKPKVEEIEADYFDILEFEGKHKSDVEEDVTPLNISEFKGDRHPPETKPNLENKEIGDERQVSISEELNGNGHDTPDINIKKGLKKSATFPCSEEAKLCIFSINAKEDISNDNCLRSDDPCSTKNEVPIYARSMSLPPAVELVPAMKGGRQQRGQSLGMKLNVKWAHDVYDPPCTIMSHTVKSYQQRPKAKREKRKNKHNKNKSNRGKENEKKQLNKKCTIISTDTQQLSVHAPPDKLLPAGLNQAGAEINEYEACSKESKCGSSFLSGSLSRVQFPIAEAS